MTATARILGTPDADGGATTLALSKSAIQTIDGQPYVFLEHAPGKYELRPVERGADLDGAEVEIVRGVGPNDTVVAAGAFILKSELLKSQMGSND
jgi:cobalt-zinc-cadmium efflux system membrane fusion protein